ncbi:putative ribonuclease H-like domain-containing protein [Tanacetum coccineum]
MPDLEDVTDTLLNDGIFNVAYDDDEDVGAVANFNNIDNTIAVSPIPTLRIHKDYPKGQILGDPTSAVQTRGKIQKASSAQQALVSYIHKQNRTNHKDHQNCLFACFLSQEEYKTISQALKDESWVEAMQEELLQFKLQQVVKALYGLHQAPRAWYETLSSFLLENGFRRDSEAPWESYILFGTTVKDPLFKDEYGVEVDVHKIQINDWFLDVFDCIKARHHVSCLSLLSRIIAGASLDRKSHKLVDVNSGKKIYLASARSRQLWQILLLRQNMLQLLIAVGKTFFTKGFDCSQINFFGGPSIWNVKFVVTFEGRRSMDLRMDRCSAGKYNSSMVCIVLSIELSSK